MSKIFLGAVFAKHVCSLLESNHNCHGILTRLLFLTRFKHDGHLTHPFGADEYSLWESEDGTQKNEDHGQKESTKIVPTYCKHFLKVCFEDSQAHSFWPV